MLLNLLGIKGSACCDVISLRVVCVVLIIVPSLRLPLLYWSLASYLGLWYLTLTWLSIVYLVPIEFTH